MTYDHKLEMNPEQLNVLADRVDSVNAATQQVANYLTGAAFTEKDLGNMSLSHEVAGGLANAVKDLGKSIEKASKMGDGYLAKVSAAIKDTAKAQTINEEDAKWGFNKIEQGS